MVDNLLDAGLSIKYFPVCIPQNDPGQIKSPEHWFQRAGLQVFKFILQDLHSCISAKNL